MAAWREASVDDKGLRTLLVHCSPQAGRRGQLAWAP